MAIERPHLSADLVSIRELEQMIRSLRRVAEAAHNAVPAFVAHTNNELMEHDGYRRAGIGTTRPPANSDGEGVAIDYSDRTGDIATGLRSKASHDWDFVKSKLSEATIAVGRAEQAMRRHSAIDTTLEVSQQRCSGMGMKGYDVWGDPTCVAVVSKLNLCNNCYMRQYRWVRDAAA